MTINQLKILLKWNIIEATVEQTSATNLEAYIFLEGQIQLMKKILSRIEAEENEREQKINVHKRQRCNNTPKTK